MNPSSHHLTLCGPAGNIEALRDTPHAKLPIRGTAIIAHPHPLFGGTMHNKVVYTLARAFTACGFVAVRFNFRGVGATAGTHDEGRGELADLLAVVQHTAPDGPIALAGFSFGAFVASQALAALATQRQIERIVLVGTAASRFAVAPIAPELQPQTLIIHGEADDVVPLAAVMDWARPQSLPVTVVPAGGHFFHGQLPLLKGLVMRHLT